MNYIDEIALRIHRLTCGESPTRPNDLKLARIYAVLALAKGEETTLGDVHDAWSAYTAEVMPAHRSLVPFWDLSRSVQALDEPYRDAIHQVAAELGGDRWRPPEWHNQTKTVVA